MEAAYSQPLSSRPPSSPRRTICSYFRPTQAVPSHTAYTRFPLFSLPVEIIDIIVGFVGDHADLLSLSLAHETLHDIIIPHHYYWRKISVHTTDVERCMVILRKKPRWAHNVWHIEVCRKDVADSLHLRVAAKEQCLGRTGTPLCFSSLRSLDLSSNMANMKSLFRELHGKSTLLSSVKIKYNHHTALDIDEEVAVIALMGGYSQFKWWSTKVVADDILEALTAMLARCPDLEDLDVEVWYGEYIYMPEPMDPPYLQTLWSCRWPKLRLFRLRLEAAHVPTPLLFGAFLNDHSTLEVISAAPFHVPYFDLSPSALPKLQEAHLRFTARSNPNSLLTLFQPLPDGSRRPLRSFSCLDGDVLRNDSVSREFYRNLAVFRTLKVLSWEDPEILNMRLLGEMGYAAISVKELHVNIDLGYVAYSNSLLESLIPRLTSALSAFPSLGHVYIADIDYYQPPDYLLRAVLKALENACRTLHGMNRWRKDHDGAWYRSEEGFCSACEPPESKCLHCYS